MIHPAGSLRVLHVIPSVSPLRGGPSVAIRSMTRALIRCGMHIDVLTTDDHGPGRLGGALQQAVPFQGGVAHYMPRQTRFYTFSWPLSRWLAAHVREYDAVHIHALFSYPSTIAAFHASRAGVPYIVRPLGTLNSWGIHNRRRHLKAASYSLVERRILSSAAAVHFTSEWERDESIRLPLHTQSAVIPLGVDMEPFDTMPSAECFFERFPKLRGRPLVLFLSRLDKKKGIELLLDGFGRLRSRHPNAALVVIGTGDPEYVASLKCEARSLGIAESVTWTGFLDGVDKLAALAAAHVFVLPSYAENLGIAALEALAARTPVVLSEHVGIAADVRRAGAGLVVPAVPAPIAEAISTLLEDRSLAREMAARGEKLARETFSLRAMAASLATLYQDVIDRQDRLTRVS